MGSVNPGGGRSVLLGIVIVVGTLLGLCVMFDMLDDLGRLFGLFGLVD